MPSLTASILPSLKYAAVASVIFLAAHLFDNPNAQSDIWTVPYFSGAANYRPFQGWLHAWDDIARYRAIPSAEAREDYRFDPSSHLDSYDFQPQGFLYISLLARTLFWTEGDYRAVELFQITIHILITLFLLSLLKGTPAKSLLFLLYGVNPIILYFATFPYYYYWQTVPAAFAAAYLLKDDFRLGFFVPVVSVVLGLMYAVRPTSLLLICFLYFIIFRRESWRWAGIGFLIFVFSAIVVFSGNAHQKDPWFAAYVGIGAYPNAHVPDVKDEFGLALYEAHTGKKLDMDAGGNYYDPGTAEEFSAITRNAYLEIASKSPLVLVRNAIFNILASFSFGYVVDSLPLTYTSILVGMLVLSVLLFRKMFIFIVAVVVSTLTFTPYYPPTQAHMFGSYILLVSAFIHLIGSLSIREVPVLHLLAQPFRRSGRTS